MSVAELADKALVLETVLGGSVAQDELLLVAYSGGVDSAYLAWAAHKVLGERMIAVIADSPSLPREELAAAVKFAAQCGMRLEIVRTGEMALAEYARNDGTRCFHCKDELFRVMGAYAARMGRARLAYGRNVDDQGDFRPGQVAAEQHQVIAPLVEARLGKADIRALAREAGLEVWDKPASACLASRVELGREVTAGVLAQVEMAEEGLKGLGFRQVRVRHHGDVARVEIERCELEKVLSLEMLARVSGAVKAAGFRYVALDVDGYRTGSMNALVPLHAVGTGA